MAGEALFKLGTWSSALISAASTATNATTSASNALDTYITGTNEASYPLLDFQLLANFSVAPTENTTVDLYVILSDGTNYSVAPETGAGGFKQQYLGSFVLNNATGDQYSYIMGAPNLDPKGKFVLFNNATGQTGTLTLKARARTFVGAAA
jgi:type II secretory pathway pseudopilin PulG